MIPSIGRIVIVKALAVASNGANVAPAIITRAWDSNDTRNEPAMVNVTALPDFGQPVIVGSVKVYDTEAEAIAANPSYCAWWPART